MRRCLYDPSSESASAGAIAAWLREGELVGLPTESYYALAADVRRPEAVRRVFDVKGRDPSQPLLLLCADARQAFAYARELPEGGEPLAERFWPGPLTLVLPARAGLPEGVCSGAGTVAVRVPGDALARAVARQLGAAIIGTSANRSGSPPHRTADGVEGELGTEVDRVVDLGRPTPGGEPSTLLDLSTQPARVLRPGAVDPDALRAALPGRIA